MSEQLHTCSYYCDRPGCIRAQRDQLREWMESVTQPLTPEREAKLAEREAACREMIREMRRSADAFEHLDTEIAEGNRAIADELERLIDKVPFLERYIAKLEDTTS